MEIANILGFRKINPSKNYNISEAARKLGIDRWTMYAYMRRYPNRLQASCVDGSRRKYIKGIQLIKFQQTGRPKRGRKPVTH